MSAAEQNTQNAPAEEAPLVALTEKAAEKVKEIKMAEGIEDSYGLRLRVVGGGCSGFAYDLYFDTVTETDKTFESHGVKLVVDQMSLMYLMGTAVDYVEGLQGAGFKFENPDNLHHVQPWDISGYRVTERREVRGKEFMQAAAPGRPGSGSDCAVQEMVRSGDRRRACRGQRRHARDRR